MPMIMEVNHFTETSEGMRRLAEAHRPLIHTIGGEGAVLLKNDNATLPLMTGETLAVFGDAQIFQPNDDIHRAYPVPGFVIGGGGSGQGTPVLPTVSPLQALRDKEKAGELKVFAPLAEAYENDLTYQPDDAMVAAAAAGADKALFILPRFTGEGWDVSREYCWQLSDAERSLLTRLSRAFSGRLIVVLNTGSVVDTSWAVGDVDGIEVAALIAGWYGGTEGGAVLADILTGTVNPSGKTTDTWAKSLDDYLSTPDMAIEEYSAYREDIFVGYRQFETFDPDGSRVNFPFGFGLSYTTFDVNTAVTCDGTTVTATATVTNTGATAGKEVVQVYYAAPQRGEGAAKLSKPARELAGFAKTRLLQPGEEQTLTVTFAVADMASYDDTGVTGHRAAYVLEAGVYRVFVGTSVRDASARGVCGTVTVGQLTVTEQLVNRCAPSQLPERLLADGSYEKLSPAAFCDDNPPMAWQSEPAPAEPAVLADVIAGRVSLAAFLAQWSREELAEFAVPKPATIPESTGCIGLTGATAAKYGVGVADTADGPAGLRITTRASWWPSGAALAATWNPLLGELMGDAVGKEAVESRVDIWLAPGMNIHRSPLCGRNFEYFSEDPLVSGRMAAAITRGVQEHGVAVTVKHFCCNNKERNRRDNDSRISERALREIYLKGFEIAVKETEPWCIMTSYNRLNGPHTDENADLVTGILRHEWGYRGLVMTDWGSEGEIIRELRAGVNTKMWGKDTTVEAVIASDLSRDQLERNAAEILRVLMRLPKIRQTAGM